MDPDEKGMILHDNHEMNDLEGGSTARQRWRILRPFFQKRKSGVLGLLVFVVAFLAGVPWAGAVVEEGVALFADGPAQRRLPVGSGERRLYRLDRDVLARMAAGREPLVRLPVAGRSMVLRGQHLVRRQATTTWVGRDDREQVQAVLTLGRDHLFGRVVVDGRIFVYSPDPQTGETVVEERDPAAAAEADRGPLAAAALAATGLPADADDIGLTSNVAGSPDDGTVIDVMVLYSEGILARYGSAALVDTRIQHLIDVANAAYRNSGINTALRLVHSRLVAYDDQIDDTTALSALTANTGVFAGVEDLRTQYGADQVTLLRTFTGAYCGLAWLYNGSAAYAYAVVRDGSYGSYYCSETTYAHEIGHNLGCAHDRDNAGTQGWFSYSYGYQFQGLSGAWYRTIMAYNCPAGCPTISYFSNPEVSFDGVPTGVAPGLPLEADNALTIASTRLNVAKFRTAVFPDLVTSTRSHDFGTVEVGQTGSMTLVVSNQGNSPLLMGTVSGPSLPFGRVQDTCSGQSLAPAASCQIQVEFWPTRPGTVSGSLAIPSNDPDEPLVTISLSGTGQSLDPWISIAPGSLIFSRLSAGQSQDQVLTVSNLGLGTLVIGQVAAADPLELPFFLVGDGCSGLSLAQGQSCQLTVRYAPTGTGQALEDTFSLPSSDPDDPVQSIAVKVRSFPWPIFLPAILGNAPAD